MPALTVVPHTGQEQRHHTLLIDDDLPSATAEARLLEACGCDVVISTDPEEGLTQAMTRPWDVLCLDLRMPLLDGFHVYTLVRSHELSRKVASVPIVALTGLTGPAFRAKTLAAGFVAHVEKPVSLTDVAAMIETVDALHAHLNRVRYSHDEMNIRRRVDAMLPGTSHSDAERVQGLLGLALAMEQIGTSTLQEVLREGYDGRQGAVRVLVRRLADFGAAIGADRWAALCTAIGYDALDDLPRFERCVVLARAELDRVLHSLRERVIAASS